LGKASSFDQTKQITASIINSAFYWPCILSLHCGGVV